jgi:thioredoxin reductase
MLFKSHSSLLLLTAVYLTTFGFLWNDSSIILPAIVQSFVVRPATSIKTARIYNTAKDDYDVIIVGGSSSGLSAALSLGRSLRSVLVVDNGAGSCNQYQLKSHNLLTHDNVSPSVISNLAHQNIQQYSTIDYKNNATINHIIQKRRKQDGGNNNYYFSVNVTRPLNNNSSSSSSSIYTSRKLIITTGIKDIFPPTPGLIECWGKCVIHCPYCHGYEFNNQRTALYNMSLQTIATMTPILHSTFTKQLYIIGGSYSKELVLDDIKNDKNTDPESIEILKQLKEHNITILPQSIKEIIHTDNGHKIESIILDDGMELSMDAMYIRPPFEQNFPFDKLSLLASPSDENDDDNNNNNNNNPLSSSMILLNDKGYIDVDSETQKTRVAGIIACGDCTTPNRALSIAIASGTKAAKMLNYELSMEDWCSSN